MKKKEYLCPEMVTVEVGVMDLLTGSFEEGETGGSGTGSGEGDPEDALAPLGLDFSPEKLLGLPF